MIYKPGQVLVISADRYSDYSIVITRVLKEIDTEVINFKNYQAMEGVPKYPRGLGFLEWLKKEGYVEEVPEEEKMEWHIAKDWY